jgi:GNAT superfamily N-acetyltransferase
MGDSMPGGVRLTGYFPGLLGRITTLHAVYYHEQWGFDVSFEVQVGGELSAFVRGFQEGRDGLWAALSGDDLAGAVAIDGSQSGTEGARLRWFIVAPSFQGRGIGKVLMGTAMEFCRRVPHPRAYLWTFRGLDRARALYEASGFRLVHEHEVRQWGRAITEQRFVLERSG